jgi:AraC family transcriptional regulator, positive regulator of tynA and feaB
MSADSIAAACRVSVRHLDRLFEREGTALMRHVWQRRLVRCYRDLTDSGMQGRSISEIAFAVGFNDLSHFSRAYRARYGCSPRDTRRGCLGGDRV